MHFWRRKTRILIGIEENINNQKEMHTGTSNTYINNEDFSLTHYFKRK